MKKLLALVAVLSVWGAAGTARADQVEEFKLTGMSGPFELHPGGTLTGSMWIDVTNGSVSSMTVNFTDFTGSYSGFTVGPLITSGGVIEITQAGLPNMELVLPVSTLKGYAGGAICTIFAPCGTGSNRASYVTVPGVEGYLASRAITSGTVTATGVTATTPEPSSLLMLATGLAGVLGAGRGRFGRVKRG